MSSPPPPVLPARGRSLLEDALLRLLRNRMAVAGAIVTAAIGASALLAPWLVPIDPTYQQRWAGALPPGTTLELRPDSIVPEEGRPCAWPPRQLQRAGHYLMRFRTLVTVELRLVVSMSSRTILSIQEIGGGEAPRQIERIALTPEEQLRDGEGHDVDPAPLAVQGHLPESLAAQLGRPSRGRATLVLKRTLPGPTRTLEFALAADQVVSGLRLDGAPVPAYEVLGRQITAVMRDGAPLTITHWLGTDHHGRDLLSRILFGGRISFMIGLVATLVSLMIGVMYGAVAGYAGGLTDQLMMRAVDILYGLPYMFLVIILMVLFDRQPLTLFIALGAVQWLTMARIIRGQVLSLKQKEFVEAARAAGARHLEIITQHLVPNTLGVVAVYTTLTIPAVILQESFLAFIGLAVEWNGEPLESWGSLTALGMSSLGVDGQNWWLLVFPSIALSATLFSLNFLGDGMRDALDPQMKGRS